ncbi:MAG: InlB B-repeat-containing protein [Clostridia bacterium]|nr:InlB B-repeat-containing protein [Clostridia bacterium]
MKQKLRLLGISALTLLVALTMLATTAFAQAPVNTLNDAFDYGVSDDSQNETVPVEELLALLVGTSLTDSECEYLNTTLPGVTFRYSDAIPDSNITTQYDSEDRNCLEVWVRPYSYTANNGAVVEWIPTQAQIGDRTLPLEKQGDRYGCVFEDPQQLSDFYMDVSFEWNVEFPTETVAELINLAFTEGDEALDKLLAYEVALEEYNAKMDAYHAYQEYLSAKAEYDVYLEEKRIFDEEMQKYLDYVAAYEQYLADKKHYDELNEAWDKYLEYKAAKESYAEDSEKYKQFKAKIDVASAKLLVLENLFVIDSNDWQLYRSLMGNLVSLVLLEENKAQLVAAGCNRKDVDAAGEAAVALRALMEPYANLRDAEYETENARTIALYTYYAQNYEALKSNFSKLCTSLNSLCSCSALIMNLDQEGKLLHYRQFVGLLYVTSSNLDDSVKINPKWRVNGQRVATVVDADMFLPDEIVADPSNLSPNDIATEVFPPKDISDEVPVPTETRPREEPVEPSPVVTEPTNPPAKVEDPGKNGIPTETDYPGEAPAAPVLNALQTALAEDIRSEKLAERSIDSVGKTYSATTSLKRLVPLDNRKLVSFYAWDGKTLLSQQLVDEGAAFTADGIPTDRPANAQYTYEFAGWRLPDGSVCDFIADTDITLIAQYTSTLRSYTVTWILNGEEISEQYLYGSMPTDPFDEPQPETGYYFVFSGWSPSVSAVTGDEVYEATRTKQPILYRVTWNLGGYVKTSMVPYLSLPSFSGTPTKAPDAYLYTFVGWDPAIVPITGEVTYTARYSETALAVSPDGTVYNVKHTATALVVECTEDFVDLRVAAEYAKKVGKGLILNWDRFTLTLTPEATLQLASETDCVRLGIAGETPGAYGIEDLRFAFYGDGGELSLNVPMSLQITAPEQGTKLDFYLLENNDWQKLSSDARAVEGGFVLRSYPVSADQNSAMIVDCMQNMVDLREAANYAWGVGKGLILQWGEVLLTVSPENIHLLYSAEKPIHLGLVDQTVGEYGIADLALAFFDESGKIDLALPMKLQINSADPNKKLEYYLSVNDEWQKMDPTGTEITGAFAVRAYAVSKIHAEASGVCDLSGIPLSALAGTLIELPADCGVLGYEITGVTVKLADGTDVPIENMSFYMPDSEVFIEVTVSEIVYEVIFRIDGEEIRQQYAYLEEIVYPPNPKKESDGAYDYTFLKWSKDIVYAKGDERTIEIEAIFTSAPVVVGDPYLSGNNNNFTLTVIVPIGGSGLLLVAGVIVFLKIYKKRKSASMSTEETAETKESENTNDQDSE